MNLNKRPGNHCNGCGYDWYPRGHDRSLNCPRCRTELVTWEKLEDKWEPMEYVGYAIFFGIANAVGLIPGLLLLAINPVLGVGGFVWYQYIAHRFALGESASN